MVLVFFKFTGGGQDRTVQSCGTVEKMGVPFCRTACSVFENEGDLELDQVGADLTVVD